MTGRSDQSSLLRRPGSRPGAHLAPWGRETRYVFGLYLQRALVFLAVSLGIILSLDLASNLSSLLSSNMPSASASAPEWMAYYLFLRAGFDLPALLPLAAFIAVMWGEYSLTSTRERLMVLNSGQAPLRSLLPALLLGVLLGCIQFAAIAYGRPAAVEGQGVAGFRYYGVKFLGPTVTDPKWFASSSAVIHARIDAGGEIALRDVLMYRLSENGALASLVSAAVARPGPRPDSWTFSDGSIWSVGPIESGHAVPSMNKTSVFTTLELPLLLDPLWVANFEVVPEYVDQTDLAALSSGGAGVPNVVAYEAAYQERFAESLSCVGMALLSAAVALAGLGQPIGLRRWLTFGCWGGIAYLCGGILPMLANHGALPALIGAWGTPLALCCGATGWLYARERRTRDDMVRLLKAVAAERRPPQEEPSSLAASP